MRSSYGEELKFGLGILFVGAFFWILGLVWKYQFFISAGKTLSAGGGLIMGFYAIIWIAESIYNSFYE